MSQPSNLNDGHLHELADRLHVAISMIDEHIKSHPVTTTCTVIAYAVDEALDSLAFAYQQVGKYESVADIPGVAVDPNKLTKEQLAEQLTGIEYPPHRHITNEIKAAAKEAGLLIVYGLSDDLMEFDGAFTDDIDANGGAIALIDVAGVLNRSNVDDDDDEEIAEFVNRKRAARKIEALWDPGDGYSWKFKTDIPHATFEIVEDGIPYCRGLVIDLADLATN